MRPEIDQEQISVRLDERSGRGGNEDLSSVARRGDSCGTVNVDADVPLVREQGRTRVDADPYANQAGLERPLGRGGCLERTACGREGKEERVALCVHFHAAGRGKRFAQNSAMVCNCLRVRGRPQLTQQPRRALHIGEDKRHGP